MGELIICALAGSVPSLLFGVLFFIYARGERAAMQQLAEDGFRHLVAQDAKEAAEAKAMQLYQEEALREQQIEFDRHERELQSAPPPKTDPHVVTDEKGESWEVIAGMG